MSLVAPSLLWKSYLQTWVWTYFSGKHTKSTIQSSSLAFILRCQVAAGSMVRPESSISSGSGLVLTLGYKNCSLCHIQVSKMPFWNHNGCCKWQLCMSWPINNHFWRRVHAAKMGGHSWNLLNFQLTAPSEMTGSSQIALWIIFMKYNYACTHESYSAVNTAANTS